MSINNRRMPVPAVTAYRASPASYYGTAASGTVAGSGPPGSNSMLFFCWMVPQRHQTGSPTEQFFGRGRTAVAGWLIQNSTTTGGNILVQVHTAAAATVQVAVSTYTVFEGFDVPYLVLVSYQDGVVTVWLNGLLGGTNGAAGAGYLSYARPTTIGIPSWTTGSSIDTSTSDCGMLQDYDVSTYVDPMFGNGAPGLSARWLEDLRQGRYLTWPRAAVLNSDWYWAGRDVVLPGAGVAASWMDRYSATPMLRFGSPQGASFPARPI